MSQAVTEETIEAQPENEASILSDIVAWSQNRCSQSNFAIVFDDPVSSLDHMHRRNYCEAPRWRNQFFLYFPIDRKFIKISN